MDFYTILEEVREGEAFNPYAAKQNGKWLEGTVSIDFLNEHFGHLETAEEMKSATESEGLKLYFDFLKQKGILN
mgnify:CR=1 FL=1